jgi:hypothetical protein
VQRTGRPLSNVTLRARLRDREIWTQMSFSALSLGERGGYSVLGVGSDVTALKHAEDKLRRMISSLGCSTAESCAHARSWRHGAPRASARR